MTQAAFSLAKWASGKDDSFVQAMCHARLPLCVTDPNLPDNPIVFSNPAFCELTGYSEAEVLGRNCRFLQGADTTAQSVARVKEVIAKQQVATIEIVNYKKDGTKFINALQLGPIFDDDGALVYCFGSQLDITKEREAEETARRLANEELRHRLNNIVNVMSVLVRMTGQEGSSDRDLIQRIVERLQAVGEAHITALTDDLRDTPDLRSMAEIVLKAYAPNGTDSYLLEGPEVSLQVNRLTPIVLMLHELATNAVKHGALSRREGHVSVTWSIETRDGRNMLCLSWRECGGPAVTVPARESGSRIVANLLKSSDGTLEYDWQADGLVAHAVIGLDV